MKALSPRRFEGMHHYAWVIVLVAFGLQALSSSVRLAFGTFVEPLADEFGWGRGSIGLAFALQFVTTALLSPLAGWAGEVYGVRRTVLVGIVLFTLGMTLTGTMDQLWQFYLYYGVLTGAALSIFTVPLVISVTYWFRSHLGLATGMVMASTGVGPMFAAPVIIILLNTVGWGPAMVATGLISGAIMLALASGYYGRPAEKGAETLWGQC